MTPALALQTDLLAKHGGSVECINRTAADAVFLYDQIQGCSKCTEAPNSVTNDSQLQMQEVRTRGEVLKDST